MLKWTVLPFAQVVVDRVEKASESNEEDVAFTDGKVNAIEHEEEDNDYESNEEDDNEFESEEEDNNAHEILNAV